MMTQGEMEAALCEAMGRFEREYVGRGPANIRVVVIEDMIAIRMQGVLTVAERRLIEHDVLGNGRELLKNVRAQLIETARPILEAVVQGITGVELCGLHHDISTKTGEELIVFTLATAPQFRALANRSVGSRQTSSQTKVASHPTKCHASATLRLPGRHPRA